VCPATLDGNTRVFRRGSRHTRAVAVELKIKGERRARAHPTSHATEPHGHACVCVSSEGYGTVNGVHGILYYGGRRIHK